MKAGKAHASTVIAKLPSVAIAALLAVSLFLPWWGTEMESPQYHGEDEIVVSIYPGRVSGNLREVQTLNQYIGVRLPLDAPELRALPWVLGAFLALAIVTIFLPESLQRKAMMANFVLMATGGLAGAAMLQYRLYALGHNRGHTILRGVPDFAPPIFGSMQLANFHIETKLMAGGWAFGLAVALTGLAIYLSRQESARLPSTTQLRHAPVAK